MLKVYSHPRSGTNFLMALIALNFYPGQDAASRAGRIGHWRGRAATPRNPYGAVFGGHQFYNSTVDRRNSVYIYRDGRDVALSMWRSSEFLAPEHRRAKGGHRVSFSDFIRWPLDWKGSPGYPDPDYGKNIFHHWLEHVWSWAGWNIPMVRYEDLVMDAGRTLSLVAEQFGLQKPTEWIMPGKVGPSPHEGRVSSWRDAMSKDDLNFFDSVVPRVFFGRYER